MANKYDTFILQLIFALIIWSGTLFCANLTDTLQNVESQFFLSSDDPKNLSNTLRKIQNTLYSLEPVHFDKVHELAKSTDTLEKLFLLKKNLTTTLHKMNIPASERSKLADRLKIVLSSIRSLEDYLFELISEDRKFKLGKSPILPFNGDNSFVQKDDNFENNISNLRTGDVLLMRGVALTSSLIARITEAPQTYSHMGIIYVDPKTLKTYLIEGMLNSGFHKTELTPSFFKDNARVAVYRAKESTLALKAGEFGNEQYETGIVTGRPLEYDATMGLLENCKYYCSKFISWSYNSVGSFKKLPEYPSLLMGKNRNYVSALQITNSSVHTYAPSDIDLDSTFDLIYEFRNPKKTPQTRLDDLIVDRILYWMRKENLDLVTGFFIDKTSQGILYLASIPSIRKFLSHTFNIQISPELDPKALALLGRTYLMLTAFRNALLPEYNAYLSEKGIPMSPRQIYKLIDKKRTELPSLTKSFKPTNRNFSNLCVRFYSTH